MKKYYLLLALSCTMLKLSAQQKVSSADSLLNTLSAANKPETSRTAVFSSSRLILSETNETVKKGNLNFLVIHRFGDIGGPFGGGQTLYGLDNSSDIYIGFEYGLGQRWDLQLGRSKYQQLIELGSKYTLVNQDVNGSPLAVSLLGKIGLKPYKNDGSFTQYSDRFAYVAQAIIGHKFSKNFSMQLSPTFVSSNVALPAVTGNEKRFFSIAAAARLKVTKRMGIIVEYAHSFSSFRDNPPLGYQFYDPLAIGIEVETGGHVFTINFSNAKAISPGSYLADTRSSWEKGEFRLGFTISRVFDLSHRNKNNY